MIRLDFYRLLLETQYIGVVEEPDTDCHFNPYAIFVLETRLYPLIYKLFHGIPIDILIETRYEGNKMQAYLAIYKLQDTTDPGLYLLEKSLVDLTDDQKEAILFQINKINTYEPNYALIDVNELYNSMPVINNTKIPFSYFSTMLQYTGIDSSYNPFIRPEGIYLTFNPNVSDQPIEDYYPDQSPINYNFQTQSENRSLWGYNSQTQYANRSQGDYKQAYYEVCKFLISRILEFYRKGTIVFSNLIDDFKKEEMAKDWNLVPIDEEEIVKTIFQPNWIDKRFAPNPVDFLTLKLQGDPYIRIKVPDNYVKRHGIASILSQYNIIFEGSYLKVKAKDLKEAQLVASLVEYAIGTTHGKVMVLAATRLSEVYLYFEYANKMFNSKDRQKNNAVTYLVNSNENPYIFSWMVPRDKHLIPLDDLRLEFRNYAVNRLLEVSKISKFKNMSPYAIIEKEYS